MADLSVEVKPGNLDSDPVDDYLNLLAQTITRISRQEIWSAINILYRAWENGQHIFICGNGGSAALASHMANDLNKLTISPGKARMKAIALTDNIPLMTAWGNDSDYENIFAEQMLNFIEPGDVLIAISTSGNSRNVLRAVETAHANQALVVALTGDQGGKLRDLVDACIFIPDDHIGRQEDGHMILNHVIANTLRSVIRAGQS